MTRALVVGAVPVAHAEVFYRALLSDCDVVVAADAAGEWCVSLGRVPDIAIGDFDSSAEGAEDRLRAAGASVVRLAQDKDVSDLDAAVNAAIDRGVDALTLTAAFTDRVDHTLGAFGSLARAGARVAARACEPGWMAVAVSPTRPFIANLTAGTRFSVLSPTGVGGVTILGARFPLDACDLRPLSSLGLSNEALGGRVSVRVSEGMLLVVVLAEGANT
jgi:thiamine pyrophosphokinase